MDVNIDIKHCKYFITKNKKQKENKKKTKRKQKEK
jgi:hypothetical protein